MTSLTGMTASQAAEELRQRAAGSTTYQSSRDAPITEEEALVLASLLEQGARDTERLDCWMEHVNEIWSDPLFEMGFSLTEHRASKIDRATLDEVKSNAR